MGLLITDFLYDSQREVFFPAMYNAYKKLESRGERLEQNTGKAAALWRPAGSMLKWAGRGAAYLFENADKKAGYLMNLAVNTIIFMVPFLNVLSQDPRDKIPLPMSDGSAILSAITAGPMLVPIAAAAVSGLICGGGTAINRIAESVKASYDAFKGITPQPPAAVAAATLAQTPTVTNGTPVTTAQQAQELLASLPTAEQELLKAQLAKQFDLVSRSEVVKADIASAASSIKIKAQSLKLRKS